MPAVLGSVLRHPGRMSLREPTEPMLPVGQSPVPTTTRSPDPYQDPLAGRGRRSGRAVAQGGQRGELVAQEVPGRRRRRGSTGRPEDS